MNDWQFTPIALLYALAAASSLALALFVWVTRPTRGASYFALLALSAAVWALGYLLGFFNVNFGWKLALLRVEYLGAIGTAFFWLLFAASCADCQRYLTWRNLALLAVVPAWTLAQLVFVDVHQLFYRSLTLCVEDGMVLLTKEYAFGFYLWIGYTYFLVLLGAGLLFQAQMRLPAHFRRQAVPVTLAVVVVVFPSLLYVTGKNPLAPYDPTPLSFAVAALLIALALRRYRFLEVIPVAHHLVFRSATCGVLIFDDCLRIADANPEASRFLGVSEETLLGRSLSSVVPALADLTERLGIEPEFQDELQLGPDERVLAVRAMPLKDRADRCIGRIVMLDDVTASKRAEREREQLIAELQSALAKVRALRGLVPICASCKKIRDDQGYWNQIEEYIRKHADVEFSHGLCPECALRLYPDLYEDDGDAPPTP